MRVITKHYPSELKERAVRLVLDAESGPGGRRGRFTRVGAQLGVNADTLCGRQSLRQQRALKRKARHGAASSGQMQLAPDLCEDIDAGLTRSGKHLDGNLIGSRSKMLGDACGDRIRSA